MHIYIYIIGLVVCTDLSGEELLRQGCVGRVVASGSLPGVMLSTLARNARDVGSIPTLSTIFPMSIKPMTLDQDPVQAMCCMVVEPTLSLCM